jgi:hypothetical protein
VHNAIRLLPQILKIKNEHHLVVPAKSHAPSPLRLRLPRANLSPRLPDDLRVPIFVPYSQQTRSALPLITSTAMIVSTVTRIILSIVSLLYAISIPVMTHAHLLRQLVSRVKLVLQL